MDPFVAGILQDYVDVSSLTIPDSLVSALESQSLIPDGDGNLPFSPEYEKTMDPWYLSLLYVEWLCGSPQITSASSEGASLSVTQADWDSLKRFLRSRSVICQSSESAVLTEISIDNTHVDRVPMRDRSHLYGDVDTDIG